jgi:hypothetical protein
MDLDFFAIQMALNGQGGQGSLFNTMIDPRTSPFSRQTLPPLPQQSNPLSGLDLSFLGGQGDIAKIILGLVLQNQMGASGFAPLGQGQNLASTMRNNRMFRENAEVMSRVAQRDEESIFETLRGIAILGGSPFGEQQQEEMRTVLSEMNKFSPVIDMFAPNLRDTLSGRYGSISRMASPILSANRYRIDPITGQYGYSADSNREQITRLFDELYEKNDYSATGFRAGDIGILYSRLAEEGKLGNRLTFREQIAAVLNEKKNDAEFLKKVGDESKIDLSAGIDSLSLPELQKIAATSEMASELRDDDVRRTKQAISKYTKSLRAVSELLGDNGNPNAPMPQLLNAIQVFTQNSSQFFSESQLTSIVRDIQANQQITGTSLDRYTQLSTAAGAQMSASDVSPAFGVFAAMAGTRAKAAAARVGQFENPGFGKMTATELEEMQTQNFANSLNSEISNKYAALSILEGLDLIEDSDQNREFLDLIKAVRAGNTSYTTTDANGNTVVKDVPSRLQEFDQLFQSFSLLDSLNLLATDSQTVQSELMKFEGLRDIAFNLQPAERRIKIQENMIAPISGTVKNEEDQKKITEEIISRFLDSESNKPIIAVATDVLTEKFPNMTKEEIGALAVQLNAASSLVLQSMGLTEPKFKQLDNPQADLQRQKIEVDRSVIAAKATALSELGKLGPVGRQLSSALQDADENSDIRTTILKAFGVEDVEIQAKLKTVFEKIDEDEKSIKQLLADVEKAENAEDFDGFRASLEARLESLEAERKKLAEELTTFGVGRFESTVKFQRFLNRGSMESLQNERDFESLDDADKASYREALGEFNQLVDTTLRELEDNNDIKKGSELQKAVKTLREAQSSLFSLVEVSGEKTLGDFMFSDKTNEFARKMGLEAIGEISKEISEIQDLSTKSENFDYGSGLDPDVEKEVMAYYQLKSLGDVNNDKLETARKSALNAIKISKPNKSPEDILAEALKNFEERKSDTAENDKQNLQSLAQSGAFDLGNFSTNLTDFEKKLWSDKVGGMEAKEASGRLGLLKLAAKDTQKPIMETLQGWQTEISGGKQGDMSRVVAEIAQNSGLGEEDVKRTLDVLQRMPDIRTPLDLLRTPAISEKKTDSGSSTDDKLDDNKTLEVAGNLRVTFDQMPELAAVGNLTAYSTT